MPEVGSCEGTGYLDDVCRLNGDPEIIVPGGYNVGANFGPNSAHSTWDINALYCSLLSSANVLACMGAD